MLVRCFDKRLLLILREDSQDSADFVVNQYNHYLKVSPRLISLEC